MFKLSSKIDNIRAFAFDNQNNLMISTLKSVSSVTQNKIILDVTTESLQWLYFKKPYFYINDSHGNSYTIDDNFIVKKIEGTIYSIFDGKLLFVKRENEIKKTLLIDIKTKDIIAEIPLSSPIFGIYQNLLYRKSPYQLLELFSLKTSKLVWSYKSTQFGTYINWQNDEKDYEIIRFIGVWQNELLVACSNSLLLSLDISTGKILKKWQDLNGYYAEIKRFANKIPPAENFILDVVNSKLISGHIMSITEIDLLTNKIEVFDLEQELKTYNINQLNSTNNNPFNAEHIYLTATMDYKDNKNQWTYDCLLVVNRKTKKVDWQYKFEDSSLGVNIPQLSENKLYQLDNDGNLFIFEKDK